MNNFSHIKGKKVEGIGIKLLFFDHNLLLLIKIYDTILSKERGLLMAEIFIFKYGESIYIDEKTKQIELKNPITDIIVNTIPTNYTFQLRV